MSEQIGSICIECFHLKTAECGTRVRCDKNKFKEHLHKTHPFVTQPRACPEFDGDLPADLSPDYDRYGDDGLPKI